jgi:hypothetical protein
MHRAQQMLEALPFAPDGPSRRVVTDELNFVLMRTDPERRIAELCAALAGPQPDSNFAHDLGDLNFALVKRIIPKNPAPLYAWIQAFRNTANPGPVTLWKQNHALPWLVVSMITAAPDDASLSQLLTAAEAIPTTSPAYDTVFYHRVRLLIGHGQKDDARLLLDKALAAFKAPQNSHDNALLAERLSVAQNYAEFLRYAPRIDLSTNSSGAFILSEECREAQNRDSATPTCPPTKPSLQFDEDAVYVFNRQLPLSLLADAATAPSLPANLREEVALAAWTRSIALEDAPVTARLASLLPKSLHQSAQSGTGFPAILAILRNPGLRPSVEPGISRLASYKELDNYRDNWWGNASDQVSPGNPEPRFHFPRPAFLKPAELTAGIAEWDRFQQLPCAAVLLGRHVLEYAKTHPDDPEVPEALALTVRATHLGYGRGDDPKSNADNTSVSKAAFEFLHAHYPKSPWAQKTRYYY